MSDRIDRRRFLAALAGGAATLALARPAGARLTPSFARSDHPDPRPGVDASKVLTADQLGDAPHAAPIYDAVREIPEIADGIRCYCGCADLPGYRSLLTCYEEGGMGKHCRVCQGQALLVHRRWKEGQTLEQIRRAVDARYGPRSGGRPGLASSAAVLGLAALLAAPAPASAQVRASERGTVSQTVDGTVITVDYARPRVRGRDHLFGGVVKWGEVWTPGANDATVLELGRDVEIDGHPVAAGRWSVWLVTAEEGPWELVLDPRDTLFHTQHPEPAEDQVRFPVEVGETGHVEVLTWSFPRVASDGTTLALAWGTTAVELDIEVEPGFVRTVAAEEAAAYVGSFTTRFAPPPEPGGEREAPPSFPFTIRHDPSGDLVARTLFPSAAEEPEHSDALLIPKAEGVFLIGFLEDGELFDVATEIFFEFEFEDGRAVSFLVRDATTDAVVGSGERVR